MFLWKYMNIIPILGDDWYFYCDEAGARNPSKKDYLFFAIVAIPGKKDDSFSKMNYQIKNGRRAKKKDVVKLIMTSFIEPFFYVCMAWFAVKGNVGYFFGKKKWGTIKRGN